jgi:hypothetical protein
MPLVASTVPRKVQPKECPPTRHARIECRRLIARAARKVVWHPDAPHAHISGIPGDKADLAVHEPLEERSCCHARSSAVHSNGFCRTCTCARKHPICQTSKQASKLLHAWQGQGKGTAARGLHSRTCDRETLRGVPAPAGCACMKPACCRTTCQRAIVEIVYLTILQKTFSISR